MDYMEGGPVMTREALERGRRIAEPLALQYFRDMCKVCLQYPQIDAYLLQGSMSAVSHHQHELRQHCLVKMHQVLQVKGTNANHQVLQEPVGKEQYLLLLVAAGHHRVVMPTCTPPPPPLGLCLSLRICVLVLLMWLLNDFGRLSCLHSNPSEILEFV